VPAAAVGRDPADFASIAAAARARQDARELGQVLPQLPLRRGVHDRIEQHAQEADDASRDDSSVTRVVAAARQALRETSQGVNVDARCGLAESSG